VPRLHFVKKARKAIPSAGIKPGDSYYWWKFKTGGRGGVKRVSKTRPRRSQLTQSEFYAAMYDAEDDLAGVVGRFEAGEADFNELAQALEDAASAVREAGENCQEKFNNLPEGFQNAETGERLQARADRCESIADELEEAAQDVRDLDQEGVDEPGVGDDDKDKLAQAREEAAQKAQEISWDYD
jgi:hypothetical protein